MSKRIVLDVGNCGPDHASIRNMLTASFDVDVIKADSLTDTLQQLNANDVALVLINRKLDIDYSDGIEILRSIKAEPSLESVPVMMVTNYEEHQDQAVSAGALRGFGKLQLSDAKTKERLAEVLAK